MKKYLIRIGKVLLIVLLLGPVFSSVLETQVITPGGNEIYNTLDSFVGMGNPAAAYCRELGYTYQTVLDGRSERGICILPNDNTCDDWAFLQGECGQEYSYCAQQGMDVEIRRDGGNPLSPTYAVCIDDHEDVVGAVTSLMEIDESSFECNQEASVALDRFHGDAGSEEDSSFELDSISEPPSSFDWRNHLGSNWLTSIKNQGICGSCWAFSAIGVVEAAYNIGTDNPYLDLDLSEQYLVSDCQMVGSYQNCCGGYKSLALSHVRDEGVPDEGCMSYVDGGSCSCGDGSCDYNCNYYSGECSDKTCSDRCSDWSSRLEKISTYGYVGNDPTTIKQALIEKGPLSVSVGIQNQYGGHWDGDIYRCSNDSGANHAVIIVGYDDPGGYWWVRNSWGADFGEGGYYKVGYGECAIEEYVMYSSLEPEIDLRGNGSSIKDGDTTPSSADLTDFGAADVGGSKVLHNFTIHNLGLGNLKMKSIPLIEITGPQKGDFAVSSGPGAVVPSGGTTAFTVEFSPKAGGTREATMSIRNNDDDENPYTFTVKGTGNPPVFNDVSFDHWAYDWIEAIYNAGITNGYPDGTYQPGGEVTRGEMAVFLKKGIHGGSFTPPATDGSHPFSDINDHWAEDWIEDLYEDGLTSGYPDSTYRPQTQVTRAEMAVFLLRGKNGAGYAPSGASEGAFFDIAGHWAEDWIEQLAEEGITSGYPDGLYRPDNPVNRAEIAVFLVRAFDLPMP